MPKIILYTHHPVHKDKWLQNFVLYFENRGYEVVHGKHFLKMRWFEERLPGTTHLFMWNGEEPNYPEVRRLADRMGVPWSILEVGYFPQKHYYTIDSRGIMARSSLMHDKLEWITEKMIRGVRPFAEQYFAGNLWRGKGGYIFCPLQLQQDMNIVQFSPVKSMPEFIAHVQREFPTQRVIFKMHPLDEHRPYPVAAQNEMCVDGDLFALMRNADQVYGINSTVLLEAALMGAPVTSIGQGFLKRHAGNEQRLLAALIDRQVPIIAQDITPWLRCYAPNFRGKL